MSAKFLNKVNIAARQPSLRLPYPLLCIYLEPVLQWAGEVSCQHYGRLPSFSSILGTATKHN